MYTFDVIYYTFGLIRSPSYIILYYIIIRCCRRIIPTCNIVFSSDQTTFRVWVCVRVDKTHIIWRVPTYALANSIILYFVLCVEGIELPDNRGKHIFMRTNRRRKKCIKYYIVICALIWYNIPPYICILHNIILCLLPGTIDPLEENKVRL